MSFSKRRGYRRPCPPRDRVEEAPERVRALLRAFMLDEYGALAAYHRVCEVVGRVPDADVSSDQGALGDFGRVMHELEWFEVLDLLKEASSGVDDARVNEEFARCGLAYEMSDGEIDLWDPEGDALGIAHSEFAARAPPRPGDDAFRCRISSWQSGRAAGPARSKDVIPASVQPLLPMCHSSSPP